MPTQIAFSGRGGHFIIVEEEPGGAYYAVR
jgi:hypothetical protein